MDGWMDGWMDVYARVERESEGVVDVSSKHLSDCVYHRPLHTLTTQIELPPPQRPRRRGRRCPRAVALPDGGLWAPHAHRLRDGSVSQSVDATLQPVREGHSYPTHNPFPPTLRAGALASSSLHPSHVIHPSHLPSSPHSITHISPPPPPSHHIRARVLLRRLPLRPPAAPRSRARRLASALID